ncbi:MAG TPA: hypothetical protein VM261_24860 [Kofleriaceae bacterium]|nr:hypothetical protein [Kofleriaceae bacterium]
MTGDRHEGVAIWVQDASARPAAVPFCTQLGCSKEQQPFFDRRVDSPLAFHQYWVCTPDPISEIGVIELDVAGERSRIEARPHLTLHITQEWAPDGLRISVTAGQDVARVNVRVSRGGTALWNSEEPGAQLEILQRDVTVVLPAPLASCADGGCVLSVDAAHIWQDDAALVTSASHVEQRLLPSSRP